MIDELARVVARHCPARAVETAVPRLRLVRFDDEQAGPTDLLYEPMICFVAQGAKRSTAGERSWLVGRGTMFLSSVELPVTAVFEQVPYRSAVLRLDGRMLADLLLELDEPPSPPAGSAEPAALTTAAMTPGIVEAVTRWVRLLDDPADIRPLAARMEGEILYRLLGSPLGPALRQLTVAESRLSQVRAAAGLIRARYAEPLTVEQIAAAAHLSVATLHRHFKAVTGMSPMRFQKALRLQQARRLLVTGADSAAGVARTVGYVSATQFNREYRRAYGVPPGRDAARLRAGDLASAASGPSPAGG
ncbi:AraC family transcriptional regulator [Solwaraspora sp. WMMD792]|uniref:AraC family transcriptional regulator n=1 Tax=Solwaraspora sp. WMMD792 TaxID=3016099 RepID=UPI002415D121|nr:AraC family transcriptional regulator [Solwaraspora sp. WMMD792]MDG4772892.1 AraC family transcriptional regulator [Solwaraspora sp. WMMD792]